MNCGKKQKLIMRNDIFFFVLVLFLLSTTWNGVLLNFKRKKEVKSIKICNFLVGHRVWIVCNGCRKTHTRYTHPKGGKQQQQKTYKDAIIAARFVRSPTCSRAKRAGGERQRESGS